LCVSVLSLECVGIAEGKPASMHRSQPPWGYSEPPYAGDREPQGATLLAASIDFEASCDIDGGGGSPNAEKTLGQEWSFDG